MVIDVQPGGGPRPHSHPPEETFELVNGVVELLHDGRRSRLEPGEPVTEKAHGVNVAVVDAEAGRDLARAVQHQRAGWGRGDVVSPTYEYGWVLMVVAGLLNTLVVLDAYDIALGRK